MVEPSSEPEKTASPFEQLFARVPIGLYRSTPDSKIVDVNPALVKLLDYPDKPTLLGEAADSLYADPETRLRWLAEMESCGTVSGFESQWKRRDGTVIWVEENAHAVRDASGAILHYEGSAADMTARRAIEERLTEEKARFEHLFSAAPEAIVLCDNNAIIRRVNEEFTRMFGHEADEALGRNIDELVAKGLNGLHDEANGVTRTIARGDTAFIETRRRHKDGHLIDVSILGKPVFVNGEKVGLYAIYRDISAQVTMKSKLAEEKARFEQLFAASPDAIVLCTNEGRILRANVEFFHLFGYARDEVLGRDIDRLVAPENGGLQDEAKGITQQIADGQQSFVETRRRRKDGRLLHVSILGKPILIDGDQIAVYGIYRDITARKEAEAALAASRKKVEKLHDAADALAAAESEQDVYHTTRDVAERVLGFPLSFLCIADGEGFICCAVSSQLDVAPSTRFDPSAAALKAFQNGRSIVIDDPQPHDVPHGLPEASRSLACAPIGDLGMFLAAAAEPSRFTDEDMRLLAILLDHTAVALSRLRLQQELIEQARHDALTGVFNRHYFNERIAHEVLRASRYRHPIGLLMIDVDRFKEINDRYGHQAGDMVLREIAAVLKETVRQSDMIVRYGGDEFLVVLTETGHDAEEVARRVRRAVTASAELRTISGFGVTVSVGSIFWHPDKGIPIEEALAAADSRMYAEKRKR